MLVKAQNLAKLGSQFNHGFLDHAIASLGCEDPRWRWAGCEGSTQYILFLCACLHWNLLTVHAHSTKILQLIDAQRWFDLGQHKRWLQLRANSKLSIFRYSPMTYSVSALLFGDGQAAGNGIILGLQCTFTRY